MGTVGLRKPALRETQPSLYVCYMCGYTWAIWLYVLSVTRSQAACMCTWAARMLPRTKKTADQDSIVDGGPGDPALLARRTLFPIFPTPRQPALYPSYPDIHPSPC
ncbi:hypothetical protein GQ53DRAFT_188128 [Thozetella sp. PMI_491]|nr:hypothetical protein GQ53DRAFT_188128 [Thozetella sp. PMI_491]